MVDHDLSRRSFLVGAGAAGLGAITAGTGAAGASKPDRHIVGAESAAAVEAAERRADSVYRVIELGGFPTAVAGVFPEAARKRLANRDDVAYVEPDIEHEVIGETLPWGIDRVDAEVAHANGETGGDGDGADIAIIDTGIDDDHPDLHGNLATPLGDSTKHKAFVGCRGGNCNYAWSDDHDHGTHVSGTANAIDNSEGVIGVSTAATLHAAKVCDKAGFCSSSDIADALRWTADQGYDVANLSLGGSYSETVDNAGQYAQNNGVLLVAAAGNDGPCTDCVGYPAANEEFIAVSATSKDDSLASFSSTGPEVELAAPGDGIYSSVIGGYDTFSGTSMASPHVAGTGGQLMDNGYSHTEARDQLNTSAEDIGLGSNEQGSGLVDTAAALGFDSSDDLSEGNNAPAVDSLSASEVETSDSDAEFDVDWSVSDSDGDLSSVDLTLTDETDNETEDTASISVSGDTASGTTRLVAAGDDGSGNSYTVEAVVTDSEGASDSATTTVSETEDTAGGNAPTVDSLSLSEDNSGGSPHADFDASWSVSDSDGDLDTVDLTLTDTNTGDTEDSASVDVSGSDASGTTGLKAKFDENNGHTYEVELVVTDSNGNTASDTATETEDGS